MGKGRSVIFKSLESFFSKNQNQKGLTKKTLILDKINLNQDFFKEIKKIYRNNELSEYLTKYLTFWLKQENPYGPYFLDYFQDRYNSWGESTYYTTNFDVENFGSIFSHKDFYEMNDLPEDRKKIAIIYLLEDKVKFKKINHFFNFITILNKIKYLGVSERVVIDNEFDYKFKNFPEAKIEMVSFGNVPRFEYGFFYIDFDKTLKFKVSAEHKKTNNQLEEVTLDFLNFLKITEIEIKYDSEKMITFYKNLISLKTALIFKTQEEDIEERKNNDFPTMSNKEIIYYIDLFLKILSKKLNLITKTETSLFQLNFKNLARIFNLTKNLFYNRGLFYYNKIKNNKWLIIPLILFILAFFLVKLLFSSYLFILISLFFIFSTIKNREKRNFPNFGGFLLDFRENFISRINLSSIKNVLVTFRIFYGGYLLVESDLDFVKNVLFCRQFLFCFMQSASEAIAKEVTLAKTLGILIGQMPNSPILIGETVLIKKLTSKYFAQQLSLTNTFSTAWQIFEYNNYFNKNSAQYTTSYERLKKGCTLPDNFVNYTNWRNKENSYFPALEYSESGKRFISQEGLISENFLPWVLGQLDQVKLKNNARIIFENNLKIKGHLSFKGTDILKLEAEYILGNTLIECKNFKSLNKLLDAKHPGYIWRLPTSGQQNLLTHKIVTALEMNRGYHYVIILDVTSLNFTKENEISLINGFNKFLVEYSRNRKNLFGEANQKVTLRIINTSLENYPTETELSTFISNNNQTTKIITEYDKLLAQAILENKEPNNLFKTAAIFREIQKRENFNPLQEILKTGIFAFCQENQLKILKTPYNLSENSRYEDRTKIKNFVEANSQQVISLFDQGLNHTKEKIIKESNRQKTKPINPNMPETTTTTQQPWGKQQAKLAKTPNKTNEALNKLYPELKNKPKK